MKKVVNNDCYGFLVKNREKNKNKKVKTTICRMINRTVLRSLNCWALQPEIASQRLLDILPSEAPTRFTHLRLHAFFA